MGNLEISKVFANFRRKCVLRKAAWPTFSDKGKTWTFSTAPQILLFLQ